MGFSPNGGNISGADDVALNNPANNHVLTYDSTLAKWKNSAATSSSSPAVKTAAQWAIAADVLAAGQVGLASDTGETRYGNGTNTWQDLPDRNLVYNVKDYGAKGDGTTVDTAAINAAINDMPSIANSFGGASGTLFFPAGRYLTDGGHVVPSNKRIKILGSGPYNSILYRRANATGDMFTFNAQSSGIQELTLDGGVIGAPGSGDGLVLNAGYGYAINCTINNHGGNGISVGKAGACIGAHLMGLRLRLNRKYGIYVYAGANTDGMMHTVDVGTSGLAGIRISANGTQLNSVHVWGNGLEATDNKDKAGYWLATGGNTLTNCISETNLGNGVLITYVGAGGQAILGCDIWGNCLAGIYSFGPNKWHTISGNRIRNNGVINTGGSASNQYANILNESGTEWAVSGNTFYDDGSAHPAGIYPTGYTPLNPYPGRTAMITVSRHYVELATAGTPDHCAFTGNVWRSNSTVAGGNLFVGTNHQFAGNV